MQGREDFGMPDGVKIYNPAFDVMPADNITAIVTERRVIEKLDKSKIAKIVARDSKITDD
jgi:methylthioribose-1-phosphate isomerase